MYCVHRGDPCGGGVAWGAGAAGLGRGWAAMACFAWPNGVVRQIRKQVRSAIRRIVEPRVLVGSRRGGATAAASDRVRTTSHYVWRQDSYFSAKEKIRTMRRGTWCLGTARFPAVRRQRRDLDMHGISASHRRCRCRAYARRDQSRNRTLARVRVTTEGPITPTGSSTCPSRRALSVDSMRRHSAGAVVYIRGRPLEGSDDSVLWRPLRQGEPAPAPSAILLRLA